MAEHVAAGERSDWVRVMPALFVLLWSTGFIGAKFGLPYAEPFTFLLLRMVAVSVLLALVALAMGAPWPRSWRMAGRIALAGLLVHAVYLGGVFFAIAHKVPAGIASLIVGVQPLLTAALAGRLLGERVSMRQWVGLLLGLAGVGLVVSEKISFETGSLAGIAAAARTQVNAAQTA